MATRRCRRRRPRPVPNDSLEAIATLFFSSLSVRTWKSSGGGLRWGQALISLRSCSPVAVISILRGLAFSAIGMRRVSTPAL